MFLVEFLGNHGIKKRQFEIDFGNLSPTDQKENVLELESDLLCPPDHEDNVRNTIDTESFPAIE